MFISCSILLCPICRHEVSLSTSLFSSLPDNTIVTELLQDVFKENWNTDMLGITEEKNNHLNCEEDNHGFCLDCEKAFSSSDQKHKQHKVADLNNVSSERLVQLKELNQNLRQKKKQFETLLDQCRNSEDQLLRTKRCLEAEITLRADEMIDRIMKDKEHLLAELHGNTDTQLQKYVKREQILKTQFKQINDVVQFCTILIKKGNSKDIMGEIFFDEER